MNEINEILPVSNSKQPWWNGIVWNDQSIFTHICCEVFVFIASTGMLHVVNDAWILVLVLVLVEYCPCKLQAPDSNSYATWGKPCNLLWWGKADKRQWLNVCVHESYILWWIAHTSLGPSPNEGISVEAHRHFIRVWFTMVCMCSVDVMYR